MLYLKKYFNEGLIQMAILLSLCGVRVDVGLEPYLPSSWHEMILGPTSALTPTQFHNLRNRQVDGHDLHPKSVDLDGFFTARRLLGFVRSLDRLQVPHAELETWLVQREPDPLPMGCPDQSSTLQRAPAGVERGQAATPVESRASLDALQEDEEVDEDKEEGTHHVLDHSGALEEPGEEEQQEHLDSWTEGRGRQGGSYSHTYNRELTQNEVDQTSLSLQQCLRLFEETFPFTEEQQLHDVGSRRGDLECQPQDREPHLSHTMPTGNPSLEQELQWQDLLAIMEPGMTGRTKNADVDMMTSSDYTQNAGTSTFQGVGSEASCHYCDNNDNRITQADHEVLLMETPLQHGLLGPPRHELQPALLPLTPSAELDNHSSALNTRDTLHNSNVNPSHILPDHTHLFAEDTTEDLCMGLNADNTSSTFNINLLTQGLVNTTEGSPCSQYIPSPESLPCFDFNFQSRDSTPLTFTPCSEGNGVTQDLLKSPSSDFLVEEEDDVNDEDGLPSTLSDLLDDAAILDEMRLLDLALEEGFSPEMAAKLEEEGFLDSEITTQENRGDDGYLDSGIAVPEDQDQPRHQQDSEDEADSDSGLSLDFSHSPASPCASEASSYSSSSTSSSSCGSGVESPFSEYEDKDVEEGSIGSEMEVEVTIKQEELEEEEMGAVGGEYPEHVKKPFHPNHGDHKLYNGFPWLDPIGHDHTYNQPSSPVFSPSLGKMTTKRTKSSLRHDNAKPYHRSSSRHISETKMWSRDERRAQAWKIPFSNELIVNLPVEEFNDLLADYQLSEEQLALVRDIRRRGKNKIAAQNCRKRKMDVLTELEDNVSGLRRYRSRLLRERQEALRNLQEMKRRLGMLYQDVFSMMRDDEGMPLNAMEYQLNFESDGGITVASRKPEASLPLTKTSKKQRDKKK